MFWPGLVCFQIVHVYLFWSKPKRRDKKVKPAKKDAHSRWRLNSQKWQKSNLLDLINSRKHLFQAPSKSKLEQNNKKYRALAAERNCQAYFFRIFHFSWILLELQRNFANSFEDTQRKKFLFGSEKTGLLYWKSELVFVV